MGRRSLYTNAKGARTFTPFSHPAPERRAMAGRPPAHPPIYERLQPNTRFFGDYCGLEHPLVVRTERGGGDRGHHLPPLQRAPTCRRECQGVREAVGLLEISNYEIRGHGGRGTEGVAIVPDGNRVPKVGRIALTPMLNERVKLIGIFTLCARARRRVSHLHLRAPRVITALVERHAPPPGVTVRPCAMEYVACRSPARARGAAARGWYAKDLSSAAFPFLSFRPLDVG